MADTLLMPNQTTASENEVSWSWDEQEASLDPTSAGFELLVPTTFFRPIRRDGDRLFEQLGFPTENWDGHHALAPTRVALVVAERLVDTLPADMPSPTISMSVTGGILLEWDHPAVVVTVEVDAGAQISAYVEYGGVSVEGVLDEVEPELVEALSRIRMSGLSH